MPREVSDALEQIRNEDPSSWFDLNGWKGRLLIALIVLAITLWLFRRIMRMFRRRRGPMIHPKLQKYGQDQAVPSVELTAKRRAEAAKVVATSSMTEIVGYVVIEQVEAIFVDGFCRPEDALEGLKATAAMKGANAVINVRHDRGTGERCRAQGDAVVVSKVAPKKKASESGD